MLKLSTIEWLRDKGIITLVECDESERETNKNIVRDTETNKWYKISQTEEEVKIELLNACFKSLNIIKYIMIGFASLVTFIILLMLAGCR